jgi:hypothetical protein
LQLDPLDSHLLQSIEQPKPLATPRAIRDPIANAIALVKRLLACLANPNLLDPLDL